MKWRQCWRHGRRWSDDVLKLSLSATVMCHCPHCEKTSKAKTRSCWVRSLWLPTFWGLRSTSEDQSDWFHRLLQLLSYENCWLSRTSHFCQPVHHTPRYTLQKGNFSLGYELTFDFDVGDFRQSCRRHSFDSNLVAWLFDIVAENDNDVEATFDFVAYDNVAST